MTPRTLSACVTTEKMEETRDFYVRHFGAKLTFDCGWYVNLEFGSPSASLQFMAPQAGQSPCNPAGLSYNFCVSDVDAQFQALSAGGLTATLPLEDHPWGDRGFAVQDPNGIVLYIYSPREPSAEFKQHYKA